MERAAIVQFLSRVSNGIYFDGQEKRSSEKVQTTFVLHLPCYFTKSAIHAKINAVKIETELPIIRENKLIKPDNAPVRSKAKTIHVP